MLSGKLTSILHFRTVNIDERHGCKNRNNSVLYKKAKYGDLKVATMNLTKQQQGRWRYHGGSAPHSFVSMGALQIVSA